MEKRELISIIKSYRKTSLGDTASELSNERMGAMDHYFGRPYGDEQEGRSQVVSRDLAEIIDWIMPAIMDSFLQSGSLAEFPPLHAKDEEQASQETAVVNHVIMKDNNGYLLIHDFIHDTLLQKNGYIKHWWDESEKITETEYEGLTDIDLVNLFQDLGVTDLQDLLSKAQQAINDEVTGESTVDYTFKLKDGGKLEIKEYEVEDTQFGPMYSLKLKTTRKVNRLRLEATPPNEVRVSKRCRGSLQESPFTEHVTKKTRSELIEMGMPPEWVNELPALDNDDVNYYESYRRNSVTDEDNPFEGLSPDRSMQEIQYSEAYLRVDWDGDGIAELRKVILCADKLPEGEEWNEPVESVGITAAAAIRMPHRHVGLSIDDRLADLQRIKTVLWRQLMDNIYETNNSETIINERAHIPDFLQRLPNGVKRVSGEGPVQEAVMPYPNTPIINQILPAIDFIDKIKDNRTGINEVTTNGDPDVLKAATKGAYLESIKQASQKVRMIIRTIAETGIRELVLRVHEILQKNQDVERIFKISGKYVPVTPTEWKERTDLEVNIGLGTGTNEEKRQNLILLSTFMEQLANYGLVGPQEGYNAFSDLAKTMGFVNPDKYILNPDSPEFKQMMDQKAKQSQQNPLAEAEAVRGQYNQQIETLKAQQKQQIDLLQIQSQNQKDLWNMQLEQLKQAQDIRSKEAIEAQDVRSREAIEVMKAEMQAFLAGLKLDIGKPGVGTEVSEDLNS